MFRAWMIYDVGRDNFVCEKSFDQEVDKFVFSAKFELPDRIINYTQEGGFRNQDNCEIMKIRTPASVDKVLWNCKDSVTCEKNNRRSKSYNCHVQRRVQIPVGMPVFN